MSLTPEKFAEITAKVEAGLKRVKPLPRPKLATDYGENVRDVAVPVHPVDPNAKNAVDGVVSVRREDPEWITEPYRPRPDRVTINMAEAERQFAERQRTDAWDRHQRQSLREADCMNVWNSHND